MMFRPRPQVDVIPEPGLGASVAVAIVLSAALLFLAGCSATGTAADPADADAVAAIAIEHARRTAPEITPAPESCDCEGSGYITHGDGHKTPCPCGGPGACTCDGSAPFSSEPDIAPAPEWRGNYAEALDAAKSGPVRLMVHRGRAAPRGDLFQLDLRDYRDPGQRAQVEKYFPGPYPRVHTLQLDRGTVKAARFCGPSG